MIQLVNGLRCLGIPVQSPAITRAIDCDIVEELVVFDIDFKAFFVVTSLINRLAEKDLNGVGMVKKASCLFSECLQTKTMNDLGKDFAHSLQVFLDHDLLRINKQV